MVTVNIDAAWLAAFFAGIIALIETMRRGHKKLTRIEKDVNSNMTKALKKIDELQGRLEKAYPLGNGRTKVAKAKRLRKQGRR